ncbi:MAG: MBL fold metallo-hydrolase [Gemmatimonadota bacterium]
MLRVLVPLGQLSGRPLRRLLAISAVLTVGAFASACAQPTSRTQLILLGTGTPIPDPDRSGPAVAIVVDSVAYLFDAGAGVVRRATAMARSGVPALRVARLQYLFLTHLHSDHTMGVNDVMFTPWIEGRRASLALYGPPGTQRMVDGILDAYAEDIAERSTTSGGPTADAVRPQVHEIAEGVVYKDERVTVRAFEVPHSGWKHAFGYRVQTPDRVIVISGDTRASPAIARECAECDILVHEVYSDSGFTLMSAARQQYHAQAHTSATQLGDIATQARPGLLVLYHQLFFGASDERLLTEVRSRYSGRVVSGKDLDRY